MAQYRDLEICALGFTLHGIIFFLGGLFIKLKVAKLSVMLPLSRVITKYVQSDIGFYHLHLHL